jgi:hypothetical protein
MLGRPVDGPDANRDIQLLDPKVSRRQFAVQPRKGAEGDGHEVVEQTAKNGVYLNGRRIAGKATLGGGD